MKKLKLNIYNEDIDIYIEYDTTHHFVKSLYKGNDLYKAYKTIEHYYNKQLKELESLRDKQLEFIFNKATENLKEK